MRAYTLARAWLDAGRVLYLGDTYQADVVGHDRLTNLSVLRLPDAPAEPWFEELPDELRAARARLAALHGGPAAA